MGFSLDVSVPVLTVFMQGLLSFFSPCVLPLIPLYIGYLSGGTKRMTDGGRVEYDRKKVLIHTLFFVLGVSFTFFLLGLGVSAVGTFFRGNQLLFARLGGVLVMIFGLYQLGVFGASGVLGKERRLPFRLNALAMSPFTAFVMGFTFSFAWTPCVGPALASVLLMAASAGTKLAGFGLIGVYTLGFVLPFLAVGFFTTSLLELFKRHGNVVKYTVKAGGALMIVMGLLMFTGKMNAVTGYLSRVSAPNGTLAAQEGGNAPEAGKEANREPGAESSAGTPEGGKTPQQADGGTSGTEGQPESAGASGTEGQPESAGSSASEETDGAKTLPAIDFTLTDQYGNSHTLSDYKGKTVFLNFWATWCPPCRAEMPEIQKLYEEYRDSDEDVVILGIAAPNWGEEQSEEGIVNFLKENGYTYPVVMDTGGEMFSAYGVYSFPTTFMIDKNGNVFGYAAGQLSEDMMRSIIRQTLAGKLDQEN